jgi:hypothetical protein
LSELRIKVCTECKRPVTLIDYYGETLQGCLSCNRWQASNSELWEDLPEEDLHALVAMMRA